MRAAWTAATGRPIYEALGMTEISTYISQSPGTPHRTGTSGRPQPGRKVAVLPDGEGDAPNAANAPGLLGVHRSDPGLMLRYWRDEQATLAAFRGAWFLTGDRAAMDADGYVTHLGRADDLMNAQGYRVSPLEVENVIRECPGVTDCAVVEISPRTDVSIIAAFVVVDADVQTGVLARHCADRLAAYKCPKEWIFREELPRNATGKLLRRRLREEWSPA